MSEQTNVERAKIRLEESLGDLLGFQGVQVSFSRSLNGYFLSVHLDAKPESDGDKIPEEFLGYPVRVSFPNPKRPDILDRGL